MTTKSAGNVHQIILNAMLIALVFVATAVINIRLPFVGTGGLIHLGNVPLFIGALLFGRRSGWFAEKRPIRNVYGNDAAALVLALLIKIAGYYIAEVCIIQSWVLPLGSIPGNIVQVGVAAVITLAAMPVFRRVIRPLGQAA